MKIEDIKQIAKLIPFTIFTTDSHPVTVPHEDYIYFVPNRDLFIVVSLENRIQIIDSNHVTKIEQ